MNPPEAYQALIIVRNNIVSVLSLSIKKLLDISCFQETLDDFCADVINFLTILQHVIYFQLNGALITFPNKVSTSGHPWKLFNKHCTKIPNNCLNVINELDNVSTNFAKIRALIRMALMEKRLHEYLAAAFNNSELNRKFYMENSIVLNGSLPDILNTLLGLAAIDFSFDLKLDLNHPGFYPIDYSSYLRFYQSPQSVLDDLTECSFNDNSHDCYWKEKYNLILEKSKKESKQKGYLEEILINKDSKIMALENRNNIIDKELKILESSLLDMQVHLTLLHEQYCKEIDRLGGDSTTLTIPTFKSVAGSRADLISDRFPLAHHFSEIDSNINNDLCKGDLPTTPLLNIDSFSFDHRIKESYNRLSKLAASTDDIRARNLSVVSNNDDVGNHRFTVKKQMITDATQRFCAPNMPQYNSSNHLLPMDYSDNPNTVSDYSSRLFNMTLENQRDRILESQKLRKIIGKANRSPLIKEHRHSLYLENSKSQSFDFFDNYSLDDLSFNLNSSNSRNHRSSLSKQYHSPNEQHLYMLDMEELTDDDYFTVNVTQANLVHHSTVIVDQADVLPPAETVRIPPLITAEVPEDIEPSMEDNNRSSQTNQKHVSGDRTSRRSGQ